MPTAGMRAAVAASVLALAWGQSTPVIFDKGPEFGRLNCEIYVATTLQPVAPAARIIPLFLVSPTCPTEEFFNITDADVQPFFGPDFLAVIQGTPPYRRTSSLIRTLLPLDDAVRFTLPDRFGNPGQGLEWFYTGNVFFLRRLLPDGTLPPLFQGVNPWFITTVTRAGVEQTFYAGLEVYRLTDPEGFVYTMQAQHYIIDPTLDFDDLPNLEKDGLITLPPGWTFHVETLTEPYVVLGDVDNVRDNLANQYVKPVGERSSRLCADGIPSVSTGVCCASECGVCGGCNCGELPGGAAACCPSAILEDGVACFSSVDVACVIDPLGVGVLPSPGTGCID